MRKRDNDLVSIDSSLERRYIYTLAFFVLGDALKIHPDKRGARLARSRPLVAVAL